MADIKQDILSLQYSPNFTLEGIQEANIDLELPPVPATAASVYGVVTDGTDPIPNATVKLLTAWVCPISILLRTAWEHTPLQTFPQEHTALPL